MSRELIERLAREAGMTDLCAGMRFRSGDDPAVSDEHLARFAALVAEAAVEFLIVDGRISGNYTDDARAAIRAKFPKF